MPKKPQRMSRAYFQKKQSFFRVPSRFVSFEAFGSTRSSRENVWYSNSPDRVLYNGSPIRRL